jgi:hypothetical protein
MVFPEDADFGHAYLRMRMAKHRMPIDADVPDVDPWNAPRWAETEKVAARAARKGSVLRERPGYRGSRAKIRRLATKPL